MSLFSIFAQIHAPLPGDSFGITPGIDPTISKYQDLGSLVTRIVNFALGFVGLIAFVMLVVGGFWLLTAAGNDDQAGKGRKTIIYAIVGIVVILLSYSIVFTLTSTFQGDGGAVNPLGTICLPIIGCP